MTALDIELYNDEPKQLTAVSLEELASHPNVAELLDAKDLETIGRLVVDDYNVDEQSRSEWLSRYQRSMKLATQVSERKTSPWPGASNVKFPLLLNAGLQFHARAYPALIPAAGIVTGKVVGKDEDGTRKARAERISAHMSYQLIDQMTDWDEGMDRLLLTLPFTGTEFKKTYFDPERGTNVSEHVYAKDLVVNYHAKTLALAPRITEILSYSKNELVEKYRAGLFLECKSHTPTERNDIPTQTLAASKGVVAPAVQDADRPYVVLEQHRYLDLDRDGYSEPYICSVERDSAQVLRIVAAYYPDSILRDDEGRVAYVDRLNYYTLFQFIPNPAGGLYGIGFGDLLGPLNKSVDTIINQLLDAGTMSVMGGGFISKNLRIPGGEYKFKPQTWINVNAMGQDLRQGIMPLPVNEPSATLFSLLQFLINAGERVSSTTDLQVGENPGQNQKVGTTQIVQANGLKVFTAIYKRLRRALDQEFKKLYRLNQIYLRPEEYFPVVNPSSRDMQYLSVEITDYQANDVNVVPSADPNLASAELKLARAQYLAGMMVLGGFNEYEIKRRLLEAGDIERPDEVLPPPDSPNAPAPPPNPDMMKLQLEAMKEDNAEKEREFRRNHDMAKLQIDAREKEVKLVIEGKKVDTAEVKAHGDVMNKATANSLKAREIAQAGREEKKAKTE